MLSKEHGLSHRYHEFKSHWGAEIQCMFWCMFACDISAFCCDILQNCLDGLAFHSVNVMRIRALTCGLRQHSEIWTQNPPSSLSWGFDSPSRHQSKASKSNKLRCSISAISLCSFPAIRGLVHVGCGNSCDILQSSNSVIATAIRSTTDCLC